MKTLKLRDGRNDSDDIWRYLIFKTNVTPDDNYWAGEA